MLGSQETTVWYQCREVENDGLDIQITGKSRLLVRFEDKIHIDNILVIVLCELLVVGERNWNECD